MYTDVAAVYSRLESDLAVIRAPLERALFTIDTTAIETIAESVLADTNVAGISLLDPDVSEVPSLFGEAINKPAFLSDSISSITIPLDLQGSAPGQVKIYLDFSSYGSRAMMGILLALGTSFLLSLSLVVLVIRQLVRRVVEPIEDISGFAEKISQERILVPLKRPTGDDEITELHDHIQEMASTLLTEAERLETKVQQRTKQLEAQQKELADAEKLAALGELVAGVAHEVNTPLGSSLTVASSIDRDLDELLKGFQQRTAGKEDLKRFLDRLHDGMGMLLDTLQRAADLIKSFKMMAVDRQMDDEQEFDAVEYTEVIMKSLRASMKNRLAIDFQTSYQSVVIGCAPGAYSQIVTNLVTNAAVHAYRDSGVPVEERVCIVEISVNDGDIHLTVTDHGKGISEENRAKLFDPFFTTARGDGGSGLGLSILWRLVVDRYKGSINVSSEVGRGTQFVIALPVLKSAI